MNEPWTIRGKTCVVTGGTGGIGFVVARRLAVQGAHVTIVGRNAEHGRLACERIEAAAPAGTVTFRSADLSDQTDVRRLAHDLDLACATIDVLINNAGAMFGKRTLSAQGLEMTFATNHLAYYMLTRLLLGKLKASAPARIINVASNAHRGVTLDLHDLQATRHYHGWTAYKRSKLANLHFTYALAPRIEGSGVTVNALHPGFVATDIGTRHRFVPKVVWWLSTRVAIGVEEGAETPVHLATTPGLTANGRYFIKSKPALSSSVSHVRTVQDQLWRISAELTGLPTDGVDAG